MVSVAGLPVTAQPRSPVPPLRLFALAPLAAIAALLFTPARIHAQTPAPGSTSAPALDPALGITTLPLWPAGAPGARGTAPTDTPTLTVFRPVHSNGTAVLVAPGGAYIHLAANHEGREPADRLTELGITAFVLKYRLGPTYLYPVPLEDARRAVRLVRSLAATYGYAPDRIGMMGFSAGGHLTAMTAVSPDPGKPNDPDPVERQSSAVNFQILVYPWLNAMQPQVANPYQPGKQMINYCSVTQGLTQADCTRLNADYTPATHITRSTPPAFLVAATDDSTVPVTTAVEFYSTLHTAGVDAELHLFAHGGHGFGPAATDPGLGQWQTLLAAWLRSHGLLTPPGPAAQP
jgi:acetyl esterase/lipase